MDVLNSSTLLEAINMCEKYNDINIGVMFRNLWSVEEFAEAMYSEIKAGRIRGWKINKGLGYRGAAVLKSINDSFIHLLNVQDPEKLKCRSFNWVLFEDGINEKALEFVASTERLPASGVETEESEELDEFLNSFKII